MKAVVADPIGGPENLKYVDVPDPSPAKGEVLIKLAAIGVNFIDVYFRNGLYKAPETPVSLGSEGAGTVTAVGEGVESVRVGQRVAYALVRGSYAEYAVVPERSVVDVPAAISFEQAAAAMLQGMTAHYLTRSTFELKSGHTCLVHAAAGGVGLLIVQAAKLAGARVLATCSTEEKARLVKDRGADHVIRYTASDWVAEVRKITGLGVDVVYDSVGKTTFAGSLDCLVPRGLLASFGQSSGAVGEVNPLTLSQKGSLFLTRPTLANYISDPAELAWRSREVFEWVASGKMRLQIYREYDLREAAAAHRDLEARKTSGKLLLKP